MLNSVSVTTSFRLAVLRSSSCSRWGTSEWRYTCTRPRAACRAPSTIEAWLSSSEKTSQSSWLARAVSTERLAAKPAERSGEHHADGLSARHEASNEADSLHVRGGALGVHFKSWTGRCDA